MSVGRGDIIDTCKTIKCTLLELIPIGLEMSHQTEKGDITDKRKGA